MANQWYYRMFGQDFGPVEFDELKQLAELGSISADDSVRAVGSSDWLAAGSLADLGIGAKAPASPLARPALPEPSATNHHSKADDWYCKCMGEELGPLHFDEIVAFAEQGQLTAEDEVKLGATGKWRRVGSIGRLVAVLPFQESVLPNQKAVAADPKRPANPTPQPVAAATVAATALTSTAATAALKPSAVPTPHQAPAPNPAAASSAANAALAQAQAAYAAADQSAKQMVAWALAPNVDPAWWGWIGGAEYGPTGFVQIYEWAVGGQIQPSDFVKNGMYGQYVPLANVPGLFQAVALMAPARERLRNAQAGAAEAAAAATAAATAATAAAAAAPVTAVARPAAAPSAAVETTKPTPVKAASTAGGAVAANGVVAKGPAAPVEAIKATPVQQKPVSAEVPPKPEAAPASAVSSEEVNRPAAPVEPRPAASPIPSGNIPSSSSTGNLSASIASHPALAARKPTAIPSRSSGGSLGDMLSNPAALGGLGAVAAVLLVAGFFLLPQSSAKDIERYHDLKKLLEDVRTARKSNTTDFSALKTQAKKLTEECTAALKDVAGIQYPAKQFLLWAARDELPRMMNGDLTKESTNEKNLELRLKEAATALGIK